MSSCTLPMLVACNSGEAVHGDVMRWGALNFAILEKRMANFSSKKELNLKPIEEKWNQVYRKKLQ